MLEKRAQEHDCGYQFTALLHYTCMYPKAQKLSVCNVGYIIIIIIIMSSISSPLY